MVEELDRSSPDRQAIWVALKTLRQRPAVVGRTDEGATVYEVRSVRLVLAPNAAHFKRLVLCAKCGRDVPGAPVLGAADLDRPPTSVFCDRCGRTADFRRREVPQEEEAPPSVASPVVTEAGTEAERLAAVEAQLAEVLSRAPAPVENAGELQRLSEQVADLLRGQNAELAKVSASVAQVRAEMRELGESSRALARVQSDLDQRMVELAGHVHAEIEAKVARSEMEAQRKELTEALHDVARETLLSVAEPLRDLTKAREDFERRLDSAAQQLARLVEFQSQAAPPAPPGRPVPGGMMESLERQLRAAELRLHQTMSDAGDE